MKEESITKEAIYYSEIEPLLKNVYSLCNAYKIPVFMAFGFDEWVDLDKYDLQRKRGKSDDDDEEVSEEVSVGEKRILSLITNAIKDEKIIAENVIKSKGIIPELLNVEIQDKRFSRFINVVNGFETISRKNNREELMDDDLSFLENADDE